MLLNCLIILTRKDTMTFKDMTFKQLKDLTLELYDIIYINDCSSTKDLINLDGCFAELGRRGYEINIINKLNISKEVE